MTKTLKTKFNSLSELLVVLSKKVNKSMKMYQSDFYVHDTAKLYEANEFYKDRYSNKYYVADDCKFIFVLNESHTFLFQHYIDKFKMYKNNINENDEIFYIDLINQYMQKIQLSDIKNYLVVDCKKEL